MRNSEKLVKKLLKKKVINFNFMNLKDKDLDVLTEVLRTSDTLERLYLNNNKITLADGGKFADALANNRTLRILHLNSNTIGAKGAERLAGVLEVNRTLQVLGLRHNPIGDDGAKGIADVLTSNNENSLRIIGLGNDDAEESLIASSLAKNKNPREIDVYSNPTRVLKGNKTLTDDNAEENQIISKQHVKEDEIVMAIPVDPARRRAGHFEKSPLKRLVRFIARKDSNIL